MNMNRNKKSWAPAGLVAVIVMAMVPAAGFAGQAGKSPVKVFILAGQSNMEGQGAIDTADQSRNEGKGTLEYLVKDPATAERFKHCRQGRQVARPRRRLDLVSRPQGQADGRLRGQSGQDRSGVSVRTCHRRRHFDNQVLLIKTAWGGKSLAEGFPPAEFRGRGRAVSTRR